MRARRGAIARAGDGDARTMLVEAAWAYRLPAREERRAMDGVEGLPEEVRAVG